MIRDRLTLPAEVRARLDLTEGDLIAAGIACRSRGALVEARRSPEQPVELRSDGDTVGLGGYAAVFDVGYDVAGGPPWGWTETIAPGAFTKALREADDVRFLINHDGLPLARTKPGTLALAQDDVGLRVDVPDLDLVNPDAVKLRSTLERGDVDQMSHAFIALRQEWNDDYTERRILEVRLFDVSAVTYPANDVTVIALRAAAGIDPDTDAGGPEPEQIAERTGMPLSLAAAQAAALGV